MGDAPNMISDTIRATYTLYGNDEEGYGAHHHRAPNKPTKRFKTAEERDKHLAKAVEKAAKTKEKKEKAEEDYKAAQLEKRRKIYRERFGEEPDKNDNLSFIRI